MASSRSVVSCVVRVSSSSAWQSSELSAAAVLDVLVVLHDDHDVLRSGVLTRFQGTYAYTRLPTGKPRPPGIAHSRTTLVPRVHCTLVVCVDAYGIENAD